MKCKWDYRELHTLKYGDDTLVGCKKFNLSVLYTQQDFLPIFFFHFMSHFKEVFMMMLENIYCALKLRYHKYNKLQSSSVFNKYTFTISYKQGPELEDQNFFAIFLPI